MPRVSNIELLHQAEQPTIVIRTRTKVEHLPMLIGESFAKLSSYLEEQDQILSDVPFVAYHNMEMQDLDVEIGFPVAQPLLAQGDIVPGTIPGGLRIFCMYRGPYQDMGHLYIEMQEWMTAHGYLPAGPVYEQYYNGPEFPERELLTRITMRVRK